MKRRDLFSKIAAVTAVVSLAPVVKVAEAAPVVAPNGTVASVTVTTSGSGYTTTPAYGQQGSLTVTNTTVLSKGIVVEPAGGFDSRPEIRMNVPVNQATLIDATDLPSDPWRPRVGIHVKAGDGSDSWLRAVQADGVGPLTTYRSRRSPEGYYEAPTFEAQQTDCAARGCSLTAGYVSSDDTPRLLTHVDNDGRWEGYDYSHDDQTAVLARVGAWRRRLHGEDG
jgi:hypothetical protein